MCPPKFFKKTGKHKFEAIPTLMACIRWRSQIMEHATTQDTNQETKKTKKKNNTKLRQLAQIHNQL